MLALFGGSHQRRGDWAEGSALSVADEAVALFVEVELSRPLESIAPGSRWSSSSRASARPRADVLLFVLVDDVVLAGLAVAARLAEGDLGAGDVLQLDRHVLEDVAHPGALVLAAAADEAPGLAVGAAVLCRPGSALEQAADEVLPEPAEGHSSSPQVDGQANDREVRVETGPE